MKSSRQTAKDLVALAADARTPEKERLAAALKAVMLIQRDDLLSSPLDGIAEIDNETVQSVSKIMNVVMDPDFTKSVKKVWGSVGTGKEAAMKLRMMAEIIRYPDTLSFSSAPVPDVVTVFRPWGFCAHGVMLLAAKRLWADEPHAEIIHEQILKSKLNEITPRINMRDLDKEHVDALNKILQTDLLTEADIDSVFVAANSDRDAVSVRDRLQELEDAGEALTLENVFR